MCSKFQHNNTHHRKSFHSNLLAVVTDILFTCKALQQTGVPTTVLVKKRSISCWIRHCHSTQCQWLHSRQTLFLLTIIQMACLRFINRLQPLLKAKCANTQLSRSNYATFSSFGMWGAWYHESHSSPRAKPKNANIIIKIHTQITTQSHDGETHMYEMYILSDVPSVITDSVWMRN